MIHSSAVDGVMSFTEKENMMYKIEGEDLYLIGTSEHSMIGRFIDTLNEEAKHIRVISNNVYPDNIGIYKASRGSLPLFILFYILTVTLVTLFFCLKENTWSFYFLIGAGVTLFCGLICMIIHLAFKSILKRYRHLIN